MGKPADYIRGELTNLKSEMVFRFTIFLGIFGVKVGASLTIRISASKTCGLIVLN